MQNGRVGPPQASAHASVPSKPVGSSGGSLQLKLSSGCGARSHAALRYPLQRMRARYARRMAPEMEQLANDLAVDGFHSWGRLYNDITGQMEFDLRGESTPLAWRRSLLQNSDPAIRRDAFAASNAALGTHADTLASTLNAIAGRRITIQTWRQGDDVLREAVFAESMSWACLETMLETVKARRRSLVTIWRSRLVWWRSDRIPDLGAPVSLGNPTEFSWDEARDLVLRAFAVSSRTSLTSPVIFERGFIEAATSRRDGRDEKMGVRLPSIPGRNRFDSRRDARG